MPENRTSAFLQTTSHVLVVGAGLVYLFGFIIVSIFDATYGIADFSLFRTKVVAVGTVFVILVSIGMLLTFRMFSIFGLTVEHANISSVAVTDQNKPFIIAEVALSIPFACMGVAVPLSFLFSAFPIWTWAMVGFILIQAAVIATLGVMRQKRFNEHPFVFVFLSALNTAALFLVLFCYGNRNTFWFVVWLSLVCLFTLQTSFKISKPEELRRTEWERLFLTIVPIVFGLYATKLYPKIPHQFGGGEPVPIVLHLTKKLPVFDSESASVSLIDETEQGYYVLSANDKALFVARSLVEGVEFLRHGQAAQTVPAKP
jgi:hypothetical protein